MGGLEMVMMGSHLYGTWLAFLASSPRADITFPSADSERLIFVASLSRWPVAPVFDCRSDPAKSTRFNFPTRMCSPRFSSTSAHSTMIVNMAWDRDEPAFISVSPTDLFFLPACITWSISWDDLTTKEVRSLTYTPESTFSLRSNLFFGSLDLCFWRYYTQPF